MNPNKQAVFGVLGGRSIYLSTNTSVNPLNHTRDNA